MSDKSEKKDVKKEIKEWVISILIAIFIALLIRYFIFTPTLVKQTSMDPTLKDGERLYLSRMIRNFKSIPERGEIITFEEPDALPNGTNVAYYNNKGAIESFLEGFLEIGNRSFIKRVIALPGEHIQILDGKVYINDKILDEPYLTPGLKTPLLKDCEYFDVVVPNNCIFVMGDNRAGSVDSRYFGCVPIEKIQGKVLFRMWPLDKFGAIDKNE